MTAVTVRPPQLLRAADGLCDLACFGFAASVAHRRDLRAGLARLGFAARGTVAAHEVWARAPSPAWPGDHLRD